MNQVITNLYIGNLKDALNKSSLESKGIKYILSITDGEMPQYIYIKHKQFLIPDDNINIIQYFNEAFTHFLIIFTQKLDL